MVAEELPAPRFGWRRRAEEAESKTPFAEDGRSAHQLAEKGVEPHHRTRFFESASAEAGPQNVEHRFAQSGPDFVETEAVVLQIELGILPAPPVLGPDGEMRLLPLSR